MLNSLILVFISSHRTVSSVGNALLGSAAGEGRDGAPERQPWGFYAMEKMLLLPQPAQPGAAEIFVSAPITAFPIARPPTETGSATSQALHRWKAQL